MNNAAQAIKTTISPEGLRAFVLAIENPDGKSTKEGRRAYWRIVYDEVKHPELHDCFFAFSDEQFKTALKNHHLEEAYEHNQIKAGGNGLYGTKEGIRRLYEDYGRLEESQREALTAAGVTPQDCYLEEYANYECEINWDGDEDALRRVAFWFGADACRRIRRRRPWAGPDLERFINNLK